MLIEDTPAGHEIGQSPELLAAIVGGLDDGLTVQGADGQLLWANDAAARLSGFPSARELLASPVSEIVRRFELMDEAGLPLPAERLPGRRVLRGETTPEIVVRFRIVATGEEHWSTVRARPVFDAHGNVRCAINIFRDITERRRAEEALRFLAEASAVLASSLDYQTTLASVARLALPGLADWCAVDVVEADGTIRRLAVAVADEAKADLARELRERYPTDPRRQRGIPAVLRSRRAELVDGVSDELLRAVSRDPAQADLLRRLGFESYMVVPLLARERALGTLTFVSASPRRRYRPRDLALAEDLAGRAALALDNAHLYHQAQEAVAARDEFLSIASHELKTPLTALLANVQLLMRLARADRSVLRGAPPSPPLPEQLTRRLEAAERQSQRLLQLINGLLDVSRIGAGRLELDREPIDLAELTREVCARLAAELGSAGCRLELRAVRPVVGAFDRLRLEQVLTNLLSNAMKYGPGGPIEVTVEGDRRLARLCVRDHGIGLAPEQRERIFGRFERAVSARNYGGLGLGLYITRQIVEAHGGTIRVDSQPGAGATFTVELPLAARAQSRTVPSRRPVER